MNDDKCVNAEICKHHMGEIQQFFVFCCFFRVYMNVTNLDSYNPDVVQDFEMHHISNKGRN